MTVLQALDRYYDRMAARGEVVRPGWSSEPIGLVLELAEDGGLFAAIPWQDDRGKARVERVPKWFSRQGTGSTPNFLWDNPAYLLGLGNKDPAKTARDHAAFKNLHLRELERETDPGLAALRRFVSWWKPDLHAAHGFDEKLLGSNIAFRLRGEARLLHERPAALPHIDRLRAAASSGQEGFCLVRGARLPLVRLHPKIKGIDGARAAEIPLVSFNNDAFTSYGKDQGFNAPTSEEAAFRYGAALNALLARGGRNRMRVADATVAFWADVSTLDATAAEENAAAAEDLFAYEMGATELPPGADDVAQAGSVREALQKIAKVRAERGVRPDVLEGVAFHVLGLAPNAARVAVRFWLSGSFAQFTAALDRHAQMIAIEPAPWGTRRPQLQYLLLKTTALREKFENIPPGLAAEIARAVLSGAPYPRAWLAAAIMRLRAGDDPGRGWHAAAIKACLLSRSPKEDPVPAGLDRNNPDQAYQLGRLFAVLQAAQYAALGRVNATIADRYYSAASATPALVFGTLMRGARKHISDATKRGRGLWIERRLQEILSHLSSTLPRTLRLEEQGRFAIGYYHERADRPSKGDAGPADEANAQIGETYSQESN